MPRQIHLGELSAALLFVAALNCEAVGVERIHSFQATKGTSVLSKLAEGSDGNFYGVTIAGGVAGRGTAFRMAPDGAITKLADFQPPDGIPSALVEWSDGQFYGTTREGGGGFMGSIFRVSPAGSFTLVARFEGLSSARPMGALMIGGDGSLYGLAEGTTEIPPTIFRLSPNGAVTTVAALAAVAPFIFGDGCTNLVQDDDGNFYGVLGKKFFRASPAGVVTELAPLDASCSGELVRGSDGLIYGSLSNGSLFRATEIGVVTEVAVAGLTRGFAEGLDGNFYGATGGDCLGCNGHVVRATKAGVVTTLAEIELGVGAYVVGAVMRGSDGNFYGGWGGNEGYSRTRGVVFRFTPGGVVTEVAALTYEAGTNPVSLIGASDGSFYGVATYGGENDRGAVFRVSPDGTVAPVVSLTSTYPSLSGLVEGADGNLYGIAAEVGTPTGSIVRVTPSGTITTLASPTVSQGLYLLSLMRGSDDNFYGVALQGGANGYGSVFRVTPAGDFSVVRSMDAATGYPQGTLIEGDDGNLYGVSSNTGPYWGLFRVSKDGELTTLHAFQGTDGAYPKGAFAKDHKGNIYGVTANRVQVPQFDTAVFRIAPDGTVKTLTRFPNTTYPTGTLTVGADGALYAPTSDGNPFGPLFTVERISLNGSMKAVATSRADAASALVLGADGFFYGVGENGGISELGTIIRVEPAVASEGGGGGAFPASLALVLLTLSLAGNRRDRRHGS